MSMEANQKDQFKRNPRRVVSDASSATLGYGCLYDLNYNSSGKTAASVDAERHKHVIAPAADERHFAGVHCRTLTRAQFTSITEPGRGGVVAQCYIGAAVTIQDRVYLDLASGKFYEGGIGAGRGSGVVLQTLTEAGLADVLLDEGDVDTFVNLIAPTTGAIAASQWGVTIVDGTSVSGGLTYTLADGLYIGQKVGFKISVLLAGSNDLVVTVTTGVQLDGSTALATITLDELGDQSYLEWMGAHWKLIANSGGALA